jgi:hypothetical protein
MSKVIRIEDDVLEGLQRLATPFVDTPNSVIRRLLQDAGALPRGAAPPHGRPGDRGKRTPQPMFRPVILKVLMQMDGRGPAAEVLKRVEEAMRPFLTPHDYSRVKTGTARWEVYARWEKQNMRNDDLLKGRHGIWELTHKGRAASTDNGEPK